MSIGKKWGVELREYKDPSTGVRMRQLTDYKGTSHHLYFTNPGWWDGAKRMLFAADRENRYNLFSIELATGEITQLTDLEPPEGEIALQTVTVNPTKSEAYFWYGRRLIAIDLCSYEFHTIYEMPEGFRRSMINCTADGKYVCAGIYEEIDFDTPLYRAYVNFRNYFQANPLSRIEVIPVGGGESRTAWEEKCWIGHVNTSPTQPNLITFCHEGPWDQVDNRIWVMDINEGKPWKLRPREQEGEAVGHEYWYADGENIGFHGRYPDGRGFFGHIKYDGTGRVEVDFPHETGHIHSNDENLVVGDAGDHVRVWKWNGSGYDGPRALCMAHSSKWVQKVHVHPRFSPDGSYVIYTSDTTEYGNVYAADVPAFESLPEVSEVETT